MAFNWYAALGVFMMVYLVVTGFLSLINVIERNLIAAIISIILFTVPLMAIVGFGSA